MIRSRVAPFAALVVGLLTLARSLSCNAGDELLGGAVVTAVFAAMWNDNPQRGIAARIAKLVVLVIMVGFAVWFMALLLYSSRCS